MGERDAGGMAGSVGRLFREGTVAGLSDAQLLERYAARDDPAAFEALVGRYGPMVLGVCRRRLRDRHAAEVAFQATFLVLVLKAGTLPVRPSLGPWLHGVAPGASPSEPAPMPSAAATARPPASTSKGPSPAPNRVRPTVSWPG